MGGAPRGPGCCVYVWAGACAPTLAFLMALMASSFILSGSGSDELWGPVPGAQKAQGARPVSNCGTPTTKAKSKSDDTYMRPEP